MANAIGQGRMSAYAELDRDLSPPQLARIKGIESEKILAWIRSGELRAINLAFNPRGQRARWRIKVSDWLAFEERRAAKSPTKVSRRPRSTSTRHVTEFFT